MIYKIGLFHLFTNSFIELKFTYHKIHPLKVYNSINPDSGLVLLLVESALS